MEVIIFFIVLMFAGTIINAFFKGLGAVGDTVTGKGSFKENLDRQFNGIPPFDAKLVKGNLFEDGSGPEVQEVYCTGLLPISGKKNLGIVISVFDSTEGEFKPVLSALESYQEANNIVFQNTAVLGELSGEQGFIKWIKVGIIPVEILEPPYSGWRNLKVIVRLVDLDNMAGISHGFYDESERGLQWQKILDFKHLFSGKGYEEASLDRDESVGLAIKIGMAVAMADGSLDDSEGKVLRKWIQKTIEPFSGVRQDTLKSICNDAMRESYELALKGELILSSLTARLNDIADNNTKYEAVELCFDIMAADGVADEKEMLVIRKVAGALGLNVEELEKMRDKKIVGLSLNVEDQTSIEALLGLEDDWTSEQIKRHLRIEFQKWNNRLNALPEGEERRNAQSMLDKISEARKRYS